MLLFILVGDLIRQMMSRRRRLGLADELIWPMHSFFCLLQTNSLTFSSAKTKTPVWKNNNNNKTISHCWLISIFLDLSVPEQEVAEVNRVEKSTSTGIRTICRPSGRNSWPANLSFVLVNVVVLVEQQVEKLKPLHR